MTGLKQPVGEEFLNGKSIDLEDDWVETMNSDQKGKEVET